MSSRYARVDRATLQTYVDRYAVPRPPRPSSQEEQEVYDLFIERERNRPPTHTLIQLRAATATYRTYLLYHREGSTLVPTLYDHELTLLAMLAGAPVSFATLQDRACQLASLPRDCAEDVPPGCLAADGLHDLAEAACASPEAWVPEYGGNDIDVALGLD